MNKEDLFEPKIEAQLGNQKIYAKHIWKEYVSKSVKTVAIKDVSVSVLENDFICIVGPSGCGKSTLLRMFAGLDFPTSGELMLDDRHITGPGADRGMVFQSYTLLPWKSVEKNISFGLELKKLGKAEIKKTVDTYLKLIKLENFRKSYPKELSGGMKQRVAIARALAINPEVLLMDEPFGALDSQTKSEMQLLVRDIWQKERPTILFVTHDIEEAVFLANKIYVMSSSPGEIKEVIDVYLPHKRELSLKDTPEFIQLRRYINSLLYPDSQRN